jgi:large subunit ribosomal protein L15e
VIILGAYSYIKETIRSEYKNRDDVYRERLVQWNREPTITRVDKPTNIPHARSVGYRAKTGVIVARVRVRKGRRKRTHQHGGRKPAKSGRFFSRAKPMRAIAEERAGREFSNCEVLNSYFVGETGKNTYFEIILIDRNAPQIKNDRIYSQIINRTGRAERGLTSIGRKYRGYSR